MNAKLLIRIKLLFRFLIQAQDMLPPQVHAPTIEVVQHMFDIRSALYASEQSESMSEKEREDFVWMRHV